jgi:hypothetical protein
VPARSNPIGLSSRARFCRDAGRTRPTDPSTGDAPIWANAHHKAPGSNGRDEWPAGDPSTPCGRCSSHGRNPAPSPNCSCAFSILTRACLITWAPMKRAMHQGRQRFGSSRRCESRCRLHRASDGPPTLTWDRGPLAPGDHCRRAAGNRGLTGLTSGLGIGHRYDFSTELHSCLTGTGIIPMH